jgi:hypothetical protein
MRSAPIVNIMKIMPGRLTITYGRRLQGGLAARARRYFFLKYFSNAVINGSISFWMTAQTILKSTAP